MTRLIMLWKHPCRITGFKEQSYPRFSEALHFSCNLSTNHYILILKSLFSISHFDVKINLFRALTKRRPHGIEAGQAIYPISHLTLRVDDVYPSGHSEIDFTVIPHGGKIRLDRSGRGCRKNLGAAPLHDEILWLNGRMTSAPSLLQ